MLDHFRGFLCTVATVKEHWRSILLTSNILTMRGLQVSSCSFERVLRDVLWTASRLYLTTSSETDL